MGLRNFIMSFASNDSGDKVKFSQIFPNPTIIIQN